MKRWIILIIVLTIPTFSQLIRPGFFPMQDDLQAMRVHQMYKCFVDLQIPCRWAPDMGYQYGYPQFNYYPPGVYYLGAMLHMFGFQIIDSVKILFILGLLFSTIAMFLFLKAFYSTTLPAFVGAMLYTYVPYKALEVYTRGALSELWSLVFFPLIFYSLYQLISKNKLKYLVFLSLSVGGLLLTHNLMTLIFAPLVIIWFVSLILIKKAWKAIPKIIAGGLLGLGLASFFTLPVIFEAKYAHLETLLGGYFDYRQHFVDVYRLFISNRFGYGSSGFGQDNDLTLSTGQIQWVLALVGFILAPFFLKKQRNISLILIIFSVVELAVLFLIHQKSSFIWEQIPILVYLQFPWRFLTDSIFLLSFLGSGTVFFIGQTNKKYAKIFAVIILIGIFLLHSQFFKPKEWFGISDKDKFTGGNWQKQLTISIFDYLPIYAKLPPNKIAPEFPEVLQGDVVFLSYKKGSNFQTGEAEAKVDSVVRLPLFDFPGMEVLLDNKKITHRNNDCRGEEYCFGLITFDLPKGQHKIKAQLKDTPVRSVGNIISLVSIILLAGLTKKYVFKRY